MGVWSAVAGNFHCILVVGEADGPEYLTRVEGVSPLASKLGQAPSSRDAQMHRYTDTYATHLHY